MKTKGNTMIPYITEHEIKAALSKGLITQIEAREMLLAYIQQEKFTPIVNKTITVHHVA